MVAYKFRGNVDFEFALDIIEKQRLHCAEWRDLNDPMEAHFHYRGDDASLRELKDEKGRVKVCSLSARVSSPLMWGHYAGGFRGVAIEVKLPDGDCKIREVRYREYIPEIIGDNDVQRNVDTILFTKLRDWRYEDEIRIQSGDEWYQIGEPIGRVIVGDKMCRGHLEKLKGVCGTKIELFPRV